MPRFAPSQKGRFAGSSGGSGFASIDDRGNDWGGGHVLDQVCTGNLARAALAAHLAHRFDVERPALHIGLGKMPAAGVGRKFSTELELSVGHPGTAFAGPAEA